MNSLSCEDIDVNSLSWAEIDLNSLSWAEIYMNSLSWTDIDVNRLSGAEIDLTTLAVIGLGCIRKSCYHLIRTMTSLPYDDKTQACHSYELTMQH